MSQILGHPRWRTMPLAFCAGRQPARKWEKAESSNLTQRDMPSISTQGPNAVGPFIVLVLWRQKVLVHNDFTYTIPYLTISHLYFRYTPDSTSQSLLADRACLGEQRPRTNRRHFPRRWPTVNEAMSLRNPYVRAGIEAHRELVYAA